MPDVLLGESRVYITDSLRKELGWQRLQALWFDGFIRPDGLHIKKAIPPAMLEITRLRQRSSEWYFDIKIPGVRRGRLNGSRTCKHSVENGTLVLDVRELLRAADG